METRKVALACFISGVCFMIVAILATPAFWWLGFLAGMAAGYLGYEFREVRESIPLAYKYAKDRSRKELEAGRGLVEFFNHPHPAISTAMFTFFITAYLVMKGLVFIFGSPNFPIGLGLTIILGTSFGVVWLMITTVVTFFVLDITENGADIDNCSWNGTNEYYYFEDRELPLTYKKYFHWLFLGVKEMVLKKFHAVKEATKKIVIFLFWTLPKGIVVGIYATMYLSGYFLWQLIILIHSDKRVLCAIDGTLGGAISYLLFTPATKSTPEQILIVVFSGFLGAAIGVANWEIVSKRILHLPIKA